MHTPSLCKPLFGLALPLLLAGSAFAGGVLTPVGSPDVPIQVLDHHVEVLIGDGFARTEVTQTFYNPNDTTLEALYSVPIPKAASLAEMTMLLGEIRLAGEVVPRDKAEQIYEEEKDNGAGLAQTGDHEVFEFRVSPIPPMSELEFTYQYYQPVELDTGMGTYLYPLEDGGVDEVAEAFWTQETDVLRSFSFHARIESTWPIDSVRVPGLEAAAKIVQEDATTWDVSLSAPGGGGLLNRDFVVYYRLADELPGRVELLTYREDMSEPGTFMLVVTPGVDLQPLTGGVDYVFVLDCSGSMQGKFATLAKGVAGAIEELRPQDRFRIVTFNSRAKDLLGGFRPATQSEVDRALEELADVNATNGTDLYAGLAKALKGLDADRATNLILVTDGVANEGIVDPAQFDALMRKQDVRLFGFLMGNSGNWPLMEVLTDATGGHYAAVSNAKDVVGEILLAKSKVTHASLLDAELTIDGVRTFDADLGHIGKLYRGQQLIAFGRYEGGGEARVELRAKLTGTEQVYAAEFEFPELDTRHPELERLWAMDRIRAIEVDQARGTLDEDEAGDAIADLGVAYQLVTDETSMVVLTDEAFRRHGIERENLARTELEMRAQNARASAPRENKRVDRRTPMFSGNTPRLGGGAGALGPWAAGTAVLLLGLLRGSRRRDEGDA